MKRNAAFSVALAVLGTSMLVSALAWVAFATIIDCELIAGGTSGYDIGCTLTECEEGTEICEVVDATVWEGADRYDVYWCECHDDEPCCSLYKVNKNGTFNKWSAVGSCSAQDATCPTGNACKLHNSSHQVVANTLPFLHAHCQVSTP